eukprot:NODE_37_length_35953_cov_1.028037.p1 type:complete len:1328 gc:universal NODE_37_length_35953_cov_1.028037:5354-9337(+)
MMILDLQNGPDFVRLLTDKLTLFSFVTGKLLFDNENYNISVDQPLKLGIPVGYHRIIFSRKNTTKEITILRLSFHPSKLRIQTIMPKWCSDLSQIVKVARDSHFNAIHFTPPQLRGGSNSPYSIKDHLDWHEYKERDFVGLTKDLRYFVDVVWNHCSNDALWIRKHPECGYNLKNTPHLILAFIVDECILQLSEEIDGPCDNVEHIVYLLRVKLENSDLFKYLVVHDTSSEVDNKAVPEMNREDLKRFVLDRGLIRNYKKNGTKLTKSVVDYLSKMSWDLEHFIKDVNDAILLNMKGDIDEICQNITNTLKYERLDENGPLKGNISIKSPISDTYFSRFGNSEETIMINNGWVWGANPQENFVKDGYYKRKVVIWGDCVKLNYGDKYEDCPYLYDYMRTYTNSMAKIFDGFRIDNCHSTPLHVAKYLLTEARKINPGLYIFAELFTGNEDMDKHYVRELGLHSLIREAMQCWDANELGRLVWKYSGDPLGSLHPAGITHQQYDLTQNLPNDCTIFSDPHAIFFDMTHDNETVSQKKQVAASVEQAALVAFSCAAIGSSRTYDEILLKHANIVNEKRIYLPKPFEDLQSIGMFKLRRILNQLHETLVDYPEIYVHQEHDIIQVSRLNPKTLKGFLLVCRTAYKNTPSLSPCLDIPIEKGRVLPRYYSYLSELNPNYDKKYLYDIDTNLTLQSWESDIESSLEEYLKNIQLEYPAFHISHEPYQFSKIHLHNNFAPGSIIIFETVANECLSPTVRQLGFLNYPISELIISISEQRDVLHGISLSECLKDISTQDLNILLYRTHEEEREYNVEPYLIPNYGYFKYCGLQGIVSALEEIVKYNNLGHPIYQNLMQGSWLMDYVIYRIQQYPHQLHSLIEWLRTRFSCINLLPRYVIPRYFTAIIFSVYEKAIELFVAKCPKWVANSNIIIQKLTLTSIQMIGPTKSTGLTKTLNGMAAGLPHFAVQYMRCWGRDVFISLNGLYTILGQQQIAKEHIIAFGSTLKHGLIPNLLDKQIMPRYNCRDAVWFWLYSIQKYCETYDESILKEEILRRFETDEFIPIENGFKLKYSLIDLIIEALTKHLNGIEFKEYNAGKELDQCMQNSGFHIKIATDLNGQLRSYIAYQKNYEGNPTSNAQETGFIYGGNKWNCGTWMDKMGSFDKNYGKPATPRDGAAIEIQALLYRSLVWLGSLFKKGVIKQSGVYFGEKLVEFENWSQIIMSNFESMFYVPLDTANPLVKQRGYYKDTVGSSSPQSDYDVRPNVFIAMVVAPELFNMKHYAIALETGKCLIGPLGMKTLSNQDPKYRGFYDNNNTSDVSTGKGWNYHQGNAN